ncbi:MAG TPA: hypothetical protein VFE47_23790 [Tepidisphaeraceae bacterium]|nr:hypothetical protein [Tepidisphaeraceae bacterium]
MTTLRRQKLATVGRSIGVLLLLGIVPMGCCCSPPTVEEISRGPLSFIQPGVVSKTDLLMRYGAPTGRYEEEKILIWRLGRRPRGDIVPATRIFLIHDPPGDDSGPDDWGGTLYDLVAVFDDRGLLRRYKLVPVG